MLLLWSVDLLIFLWLLPVLVYSEWHHSHPSQENFTPVGKIRPAREMREHENGECAVALSGTTATQNIGQDRQRQLCFALQGYGFLTRYSRFEDRSPSSWGRDICLLLSFCGDECHRLYGHPQNTPAAKNALSEAADFAAAQEKGSQPSLKNAGNYRDEEDEATRIPNREGADEMSLSSQQSLQRLKTSSKSNSISTSFTQTEKAQGQRDFRARSVKRLKNCQEFFMSRSAPGACKNVYTLDFEMQNQAFGKFLARVALLIGAADIERVVKIERKLERFVQARRRRSLKSSHENASRQVVKTEDVAIFTPQKLHSKEYDEVFEPHISPNQQLEIVLEPLSPDDHFTKPFDEFSQANGAQVIQIALPPNFAARVARSNRDDIITRPSRRLRGTNVAEPDPPGVTFRRKPKTAGVLISTAAHCKAAAAFMSSRKELQWLEEHIFFMSTQA